MTSERVAKTLIRVVISSDLASPFRQKYARNRFPSLGVVFARKTLAQDELVWQHLRNRFHDETITCPGRACRTDTIAGSPCLARIEAN